MQRSSCWQTQTMNTPLGVSFPPGPLCRKLGGLAARVSALLLGFSCHRRWTFTPTSKRTFYFRSVAVDHFYLQLLAIHTPMHASLRAGCARGGSIGQHLLREAGGPTPRTALLFPNARTAHLWKLNWQTDMISMRSASLLLSVCVFLSEACARANTHAQASSCRLDVYLCSLYPHIGDSAHNYANTSMRALQQTCTQAQTCMNAHMRVLVRKIIMKSHTLSHKLDTN